MVSLSDRVSDLGRHKRKKPQPYASSFPRLSADETLLGQIFAYKGGDRERQHQIRDLVNRQWAK